MIYFITREPQDIEGLVVVEPGTPLCIKVPSRDASDQPFLGFISKQLAQSFLERKEQLSQGYRVALVDDELNEEYKNKPVVVFENENQLTEMERDAEGYDYEKLIHQSAL